MFLATFGRGIFRLTDYVDAALSTYFSQPAASDATGLGSPRPAGGRRRLLLAGVGVLAIALAASVAGVLSRGGSGKPAPLLAGENTLARIDTATNKVSDVIPVGAEPVILAASD